MIEQLEQLKINADNINSVLSKKRGALRSIKLERKRLLIKQTEDKKRKIKEKKLESRKSPFSSPDSTPLYHFSLSITLDITLVGYSDNSL